MQEAMKLLIEQKARLSKSSTDGKETHPIIKADGSGITDGHKPWPQTSSTKRLKSTAQTSNPTPSSSSRKLCTLSQAGGTWANGPSWGRATYINNHQWILFFIYGNASWDCIIWAPSCWCLMHSTINSILSIHQLQSIDQVIPLISA